VPIENQGTVIICNNLIKKKIKKQTFHYRGIYKIRSEVS